VDDQFVCISVIVASRNSHQQKINKSVNQNEYHKFLERMQENRGRETRTFAAGNNDDVTHR